VILFISAVLYPETVWILRPAVLGVEVLIVLFSFSVFIKASFEIYRLHKEYRENIDEVAGLKQDAVPEVEGNK
jgi:hypothetical protein